MDGWTLDPGVKRNSAGAFLAGNVRQLINALERAKILADDHRISLENLPQELRKAHQNPSASSDVSSISIGDSIPLASLSQMHIAEVLRRNQGNKAKAARS